MNDKFCFNLKRLPPSQGIIKIKLVIKHLKTLVHLFKPALFTIFSMNVVSQICIAYLIVAILQGCYLAVNVQIQIVAFIITNCLYLLNSFMTLVYIALTLDKCISSVQNLESIPR